MQLAEVVIDIPAKALDDAFVYSVPDRPDFERIAVGCAVKVMFGKRPCVGFVVNIKEGDEFEGLKPIEEVLSSSFFDEFGARCARFLSSTYIAPLSTCVRLFTPPGGIPRFRKKREGGWELVKPAIGKIDDRWIEKGAAFDDFTPRPNAIKQIAIMDAVRQGEIKASELAFLYGNVSSTIKSLVSRDVLRIVHKRRFRSSIRENGDADDSVYKIARIAPELLDSQKKALETIEEAIASRSGATVLIDGVTGSGKTEVYMQAISMALDKGLSSILLVPEISLTPQTVARLRSRFGEEIAVLHSKMGAGERFDQWELIRDGAAKVVIGPRSALFAPIQNLGLVIIDEEHESTYKQESAPRYVARDVASWMMHQCDGTLILGSATPSIDSLYKANTDDSWRTCSMPERANGKPMPEISIIDMTLDFKSGEKKMFSVRLRRAMLEELSRNHKVVLLLNQRGFAKFLLCRDCGFVPKCKSCSTTLTYHIAGNSLVCHHCGHTVKAPAKCPECGSPYLRKFGVGTERVEAELRSLLEAEFAEMPKFVPVDNGSCQDDDELVDLEEDVNEGGGEAQGKVVPKIIRMDADTTASKGSHRRLLDEFASTPSAVLLGTQMIAKGLDFDDVTLVGVINADVQLHLPDFRSEERTFDLIEQVAGRAGRGDLPGKVMVQTYEPDNIAIRAAASYDREAFLCSELPKRKVLKYPPFVRMANIVIWGRVERDVRERAKSVYETLQKCLEGNSESKIEILLPSQCVLSKVRDDYRWHIIIKAGVRFDLPGFLREAYGRIPPSKDTNMAFDVDPYDLL